MSTLRRRLKNWLGPLERSPLHPQWLVLRHRDETPAWIAQHAQGVLIDVGCGEGRLRRHLPSGVCYIGVDYPATVALGYDGRPDVHADGARLPFGDASVDVVTMLDVLEHLPDPEKALREAARVLKHGGNCLIHVPFLYPLHDEPHDFNRWTHHGLTRLLEEAGFEVRQLEQSAGTLQSAAAVLCIALADCSLKAASRRSPALLLLPIVIALVPVINLLGWGLGALMPGSRIAPFGYRAHAAKVGVGSEGGAER